MCEIFSFLYNVGSLTQNVVSAYEDLQSRAIRWEPPKAGEPECMICKARATSMANGSDGEKAFSIWVCWFCKLCKRGPLSRPKLAQPQREPGSTPPPSPPRGSAVEAIDLEAVTDSQGGETIR